MLEILGSCTYTLERFRPNLACWSIPVVYAYEPNLILIGSLRRRWGAKITNFTSFQLCHSVEAPPSIAETKLNADAHITNISLSNDKNIISVFQCLHSEVAFTNFVIQKRDGQTTTNKKSNFFAPRQRAISEPTKLGMVIEEVRTFLAPWKHVRIRRILSPLGALKMWGNVYTPKLKPP